MWILDKTPSSGKCSSSTNSHVELLANKDYLVGRKEGDIVIPGDPSISRRHATLRVKHVESHLAYPHLLPELKLSEWSKYGTYVNGARLAETTTVELKHGDVVQFGTLQSRYSVRYSRFVVTTSCVDTEDKHSLKALILRLGGHLVADWRKDSTHLVMNKITVTIKVVCALVSQRAIVTPAYILDLTTAIETRASHPQPHRYIPALAETSISTADVSFLPNQCRSSIFQGKTFIFLSSRQFKKLSLAVSLGGGQPVLMEEDTDDNDDSVLIAPPTCVMHCNPSDTSQRLTQNARSWVVHVMKQLNKHGKRAILDSELGMAVLFCSTAHYCNPDEPVQDSMVVAHMPSQTFTEGYAPDTEPPQMKRLRVDHRPGDAAVVRDSFVTKNHSMKSQSGDTSRCDDESLSTFRCPLPATSRPSAPADLPLPISGEVCIKPELDSEGSAWDQRPNPKKRKLAKVTDTSRESEDLFKGSIVVATANSQPDRVDVKIEPSSHPGTPVTLREAVDTGATSHVNSGEPAMGQKREQPEPVAKHDGRPVTPQDDGDRHVTPQDDGDRHVTPQDDGDGPVTSWTHSGRSVTPQDDGDRPVTTRNHIGRPVRIESDDARPMTLKKNGDRAVGTQEDMSMGEGHGSSEVKKEAKLALEPPVNDVASETEIKPEVVLDSEEEEEREEAEEEEEAKHPLQRDVGDHSAAADGYQTASRPKPGGAPLKPDNGELDEDSDTHIGGMVVEYGDLVVKRTTKLSKQVSGYCAPQSGTTVKNFKKFRKVLGATGVQLPVCIIGGSDLYAQVNKKLSRMRDDKQVMM